MNFEKDKMSDIFTEMIQVINPQNIEEVAALSPTHQDLQVLKNEG